MPVGLACHRVSLNYTLVAQFCSPHKYHNLSNVPHTLTYCVLWRRMNWGLSCANVRVARLGGYWSPFQGDIRQIRRVWGKMLKHLKLNSIHFGLLSTSSGSLTQLLYGWLAGFPFLYCVWVSLVVLWCRCYCSKLVFNSWWEIRVFNLWIQSAKLSSQG